MRYSISRKSLFAQSPLWIVMAKVAVRFRDIPCTMSDGEHTAHLTSCHELFELSLAFPTKWLAKAVIDPELDNLHP